ncbi:MAG: M48 family metalloprotease, partial [Desulfotomaculales bacterium]
MLSLIVAGAFSGTFVTLFLWYVFHFTVPEALFWSFAAMAGSVVLNHLTGLVSRAITFWAGTYKDPKKEARVREIIRKFIPAYAVPSGLEVRILKDDTENAFALGRNIVAVNTGLLVRASEEEIAGVIGHELGHLYYKDSVRSAVAFAVLTPGLWALWLLSFLVALGVVLFFVLLFRDRSGIIGSLVFGLFALANFALYQLVRLGLMKNSRDCEYRADAFSARLNEVTRLGLISWLERHRHRGEADRRSLSAA